MKFLDKLFRKERSPSHEGSLAFGTAGIRGVMGPGPEQINTESIQIVTQGLANYIKSQNSNRPVVIGFDTRHHSAEFALAAAQVLSGNGIPVHLFKEPRPTPLISFACRHLGAISAIMVTASHNPPQYNGYKVYWQDGAQILPPHDEGIIKNVRAVEKSKKILTSSEHITIHDSDIDAIYIEECLKLQPLPEIDQPNRHKLKIVYSPLHGTGLKLIPQALHSWGFTNQVLVEEQCTPDGNFPTCPSPNPESPAALKLGMEKLIEVKGDIFLASDPDADRLGVVVHHKGNAVLLTGNQIAILCAEHICHTLQAQDRLPKNGAIVTTIVSTELFKSIANAYGIQSYYVLTGFKYIAELIEDWEKTGETFLFGAEESYGFLLGTLVRDKDASIASCLIAEVALKCKLEGKTLIDQLHAIYKKYGIALETGATLSFNTLEEGAAIMKNFRENPPKELLGHPITLIEDYSTSLRKNLKSNSQEKLILPSSDVLLFQTDDGTKLIIRPSGTEPKIKLYASVLQAPIPSVEAALATASSRLKSLLTPFTR